MILNKKIKSKIGILTFHHVVNEGAILQALSQAIAIKKVFGEDYEVEIIDYRSLIKEREDLRKVLVNFFKRTKPINYLRRYITIKKFIKKLPISKDRLITDNFLKSLDFLRNKYQIIIVGSDEVFKVVEARFSIKFPNIYWLSSDLNCIKATMSASANKFDYDSVQENDFNYMSESLSKFLLLSVRDDFTVELMNRLGLESNKIYKTPDPTFSFKMNKDIYKKVEKKLLKKGFDFKSKNILFAFDSKNEKRAELAKIVKNYFKKSGIKVFGLCGYNEFVDIDLQGDFDPVEWAHVFKYFDFCLTDRFHGTIFSLKNNIPFLAIGNDNHNLKKGNKVKNLLVDITKMENYLDLSSDYQETIKEKIKKIMIERKDFDEVKVMKKRYYKHLKILREKINNNLF